MIAVTIVAEGGLPVTHVESDAPAMKVVATGGIPVTVTTDATPFVIDGYTP